MRTFIYIIGTMDDFESYEALEAAYNDGTIGEKNASVFKFSLDEGTSSPDLTLKDIALLIGRGMAFESNWCMDDTFGDLIEVERILTEEF